MRIPKKIYITLAVAIFIGGAGATFAFKPVDKPIEFKQTAAVAQKAQAEPLTATQNAQPAEQSPAESTPAPTPQPKTVDELKTEASQVIKDAGGDDEQANCFSSIIQRRYSWQITEDKMLAKINLIKEKYYSICTAWGLIQKNAPTTPFPAFED